MAKDGALSRIPRLGGMTKIPLPGSIRGQTSQLCRPTSFAGLKPPVLETVSLKKSLSGDRISDVTKTIVQKTQTVVQKCSTRPEKCPTHSETQATKYSSSNQDYGRRKLPPDPIHTNPKPLTRSETFVRDDGESEVIKMAQGKLISKESPVFLDSGKGTPDLYMTHVLDGNDEGASLTYIAPLDSGQGLSRRQSVDSPATSVDCNILLQRTRTINTTKTIEGSSIFPSGHFKEHKTFEIRKNANNDSAAVTGSCKNLINLQSCENLLDISCPLDSDITYLTAQNADETLKPVDHHSFEDSLQLAPDKVNMRFILNSTMNTERLIDITTNNMSPGRRLMHISRDLMDSPLDENLKNNTNLLYMTRNENSHLTVFNQTLTPGDEPMEVDQGNEELLENPPTQAMLELAQQHKPRFSFGLDLTEATLDCSIELCDVSLSSTIQSGVGTVPGSPPLKKQNSFEMDESLGILTPDQMKEFLDSATTTNNLDLPIMINPKLGFHQMRVDQTPSPEDLPLDPVEVKTDGNVIVADQHPHQEKPNSQSNTNTYNENSQADTESKTDQLTKSSKISTSFITSVTSVTSLDTGYQGDGEMSRPASRGAGDHSPSNGPTRKSAQVSRQPSFNQNPNHHNIPIRRQDPMTDSDFFTESDADDIFHRGDRRAQVIDGQLYGPMLQPAASVFISEQPEQIEDSCMESSGIFTDVENRGDEDIVQMRGDVDMSPDDGSTDTVKSTKTKQSENQKTSEQQTNQQPSALHSAENEFRTTSPLSQGQWNTMLTDSQTSSTIQSSFSSSDRISMATDYNSMVGNSKRSSCVITDHGKSSIASSNEALTNDTKALLRSGAVIHTINSAVKKLTPPRKHASLTSLCSTNTKNDTNNAKTHRSTVLGDRQYQPTPVKPIASVYPKNASNSYEMPVKSNPITVAKHRSTSGLIAVTVAPETTSNTDVGSASQENRNSIQPGLLVASPGSGSGSGLASPTFRKITQNKWDVVMNKIAVNKKQTKMKNYSEVKSKVSTGVMRRSPQRSVISGTNSACVSKVSTPVQVNSPDCPTGLSTPNAKRIIQGAAKRGRSFSKDSQQSSQSDLSLSSGSPKLLAKTPSRAAKKRDVRNLSISPTDLGPPPKAQQKNNSSTRTKTTSGTLSQKRTFSNVPQQQQHLSTPIVTPTQVTSSPSSSVLNNSIASLKGSPTSRKVITRRTEPKVHAKASLKDHNRLVNQQSNSIAKSNANSVAGKTGSSGVTIPSSTSLLAVTDKASTTTAPPPTILNNHFNNSKSNGKCIVGRIAKTSAGANTATPITNKKIQKDKQQQPLQTKLLVQQPDLQEEEGEDEDQSVELQLKKNNTNKLQHLQQKNCLNGNLDYRPPAGYVFQAKGIAALGVLLQYLVYDLDAFSCPTIKLECYNIKQKLSKTLLLLDETKNSCHELQDQIFDREAYYVHREQELQNLHRCELEKVECSHKEYQKNAQEQIASLESQLATKDSAHKRVIEEIRQEADERCKKLQAELFAKQKADETLQQRLHEAATLEENLKRQIRDLERSYDERLQAAMQRERELVAKINVLSKQLETLRHSTENRERELEDKLNLSQDEISVLRLSKSYIDPRTSSHPSSRSSGGSALEIQRLQSEAESLRCVLEIKQKEISKLTKQNQELIRDADEAAALACKASTLESKCEMLQLEIELKAEKEKEIREKLDELGKAYSHEAVIRKRLSFDKEALQWQLKQRSEQLQIVESKLHEHLSLSRQDMTLCQDLSHNSSFSSSSRTNGSDRIQFQMDDVSPPSSPIVKGVIEKHDSVSWVLEMDDETPEVAASKIVKRAGSFRSTEKSPSSIHQTRRQHSLTASCSGIGPNPLSQSMSATSVTRQHSNDAADCLGRVHSRNRSKSVSIKNEPKKVIRQNSGGSSRSKLTPDNALWKDTVCTSSPYKRSSTHLRPSSSTQPQRTTHLITCDTSTLNTGEKLEMRSLPTHPSVHDFKAIKKCHEIQESAGEAMVSGANSEDEGCSASSDEVVSTSSSTGSSSSSLHHKQHMSIEEVLLLDKMHSLNGTPMEVSWSDDPDAFASESTV